MFDGAASGFMKRKLARGDPDEEDRPKGAGSFWLLICEEEDEREGLFFKKLR